MSAGTCAENTFPSKSNASPPNTPRTISAASFIAATGFAPSAMPAWRMKIFETPSPRWNRPGPAASCVTRASIAIWIGCRVYGEMIPQPTASRSVSRATRADRAVDDRASIECLRHHG